MPEDPERNDSTWPEFDMVSLYAGGSDARMEAETIHGILESNGFEVKVAREHLQEAQRLVEEAQAAGAAAAEEAETGTREEE